jgi:hypothetical protein
VKVAAKRKAAKKPAAKKSGAKAKPKAARAANPARDEQREVHYSDLRKVMLQSVLKRLK